MPTYEYKCNGCQIVLEEQRSIGDRDLPMFCKSCGENAERITVPSNFGINFKGPGFYKTDNPK